MNAKCESCGKEMDVTDLPPGKYWCADCKMPVPEGAIMDASEIAKTLKDNGIDTGIQSPYK